MALTYFAYGSNMLTERLRARCPGVRVMGAGVLFSHRVEIAKFSAVDGSGKATILPATGQNAHGVLFELPDNELALLDAAEGLGKGYDRIDALGVQYKRQTINAFTYRATTPAENLIAFEWYLALIVAGARQHGLPDDHVDRFARMERQRDDNHARIGQQQALHALSAAGYSDPSALLYPAGSPSNSSN